MYLFCSPFQIIWKKENKYIKNNKITGHCIGSALHATHSVR